MTFSLDHVAQKVHEDFMKNKKPGSLYSQAMIFYYDYLKANIYSNLEFEIAVKINLDNTQREILESLLFADADIEDIEIVFEIPKQAIEYYKELFFDISTFKTKLDRISYIENYPDRFGKELKLRALNLGPEFVYFTYGNIIPKTESQRALVKRMFLASAYKAMSINYNSISSKTTKLALEHAKVMLKSYEAIEKLMSDSGEDAKVMIKIIT